MRFREVIQLRQRAGYQLDRLPRIALLMGDEPEEMQRLGVVRGFVQRPAIERLRLIEASGLVMSEACIHKPVDLVAALDVIVVVGRHNDPGHRFSA